MTGCISVVIPVWNGESRIAATLDAISLQTAARDQFEVIVVDNGSTDGTADIVRRYPFVTLLSEPQPGSYRARNRGVAVARCEYILFTDGDCIPVPEWIEEAMKEIGKNRDVGIWAGQITMFTEPGATFFSSRYEKLINGFDQKHNAEAGRCVTANWLCRRDTLIALGGFDDAALSSGDIECSGRFVKAGHRIVYAPGMTVGHPTRANLPELARKRRRVVGGRWRLRGISEMGAVKGAVLFARESLSHVKWIIRSDIEAWAKPGVILIVLSLLLTTYYELLRLGSGKSSYRS
ncbi:glycosyltransferase [Paracoccus rhizosphaerae]|uniref:Glycosyltransferase n=1 Tax=Paracoccus rhizosphaerae TaxID=1133347 RepID=A0ABV6CJN1_9RHOB|nr:glycosyltransferase family A protein [Paracoccus rhizosphaerae]